MLNCLRTLLVLAMCNLIAGQCPSQYSSSWLKCPTVGDISRDLNIGEEIHCACNINCAPVIAKCEAQGVGRKAWKFDKTLCHVSRNFTSKMVPGLDSNLLVSYQENKGYSFECSTGYKLDGNGQVVTAVNCQAGALKINPIPQCDKIECTMLPNDVICASENATAFIVGETKLCTCKFNCLNINITCGRANEWMKETTICDDREYRDRTAADINLKYSLTNGKYTFKCVNGRGLRGSSIVDCKDGKLSDTLPTCVQKCKKMSQYLKFVNTRTEAFMGDKVESICKSNCMPVNATCNAQGQWNYNSSICQASTIPPMKIPNFDTHALVSYSNQTYSASCEMGYSLRKNLTSGKCNGRGDLLLNPRPICDLEQQCMQKPSDLRCDTFKATNKGGAMECTCIRNCMFVTLTCGQLGQWTYDSSICLGDEVTLKGSDENLLVSFASPNYLFSCLIGFTRHGAEKASCTDGTLVLNTAPVCRKQCLELPNEVRCLSHSKKSEIFGSKINCTCKNNCAPVTLTCGLSGHWKYETIFCNNNNVPVWMQSNDIHLHVTFEAPEYIFMCDEGYILHGVDRATCDNSGQLQLDNHPYCVAEPMCIDSPMELNCMDFDVGKIGDEINCTCNSNCLNVTLTCDEAGQWKYDNTICTDNEKSLTYSHGLIITFSNGAIHFKCEDGLTIIGDENVSCINGTFNKEFPNCDDVLDEAYLFGGLRTADATFIGLILIGLLLGFTIGGILLYSYRRRVKSRQRQPSFLIAYSRDRRGNEHSNIIGASNENEFQNCIDTSNDCHSNAIATTDNSARAVGHCDNKYVTFDEMAAQRAAARP